MTASPAAYNREETISTLRFGVRAKRMVNKPKINVDLSAPEMRKRLLAQEAEINALKEELAAPWRRSTWYPSCYIGCGR
jgi:kinesin family protein 5